MAFGRTESTEDLEAPPASRSSLRENASERTPLLDPDDPAVTPYNVLGVRIFRGLLVLLLVVSTIWTLLLFVNSFVTLTSFGGYGSGFYELDIIVSIIFFAVPSKSDRRLAYVTSGFLFVNSILVISVNELRHRHGWQGFIASVWLLLVVGLGAVGSIIVEKGKTREEIRLTGRPENRRTLTEWLQISASFLLTLVFIVIPVILICLNLILDSYDLASVDPEGQFVEIGEHGYRIRIFCTPATGEGNSTVLIEAGDSGSGEVMFTSWVDHVYQLNKVHQVCYWDRPGRGWSDVAPSPFSAGMAADALAAGLSQVQNQGGSSGDPAQYVIVAHGIGSIYSQIFAARHPSNIHGMILIEGFDRETFTSKTSPALHGLHLWIQGIISPLGIQKQLGWIIRHRGPKYRIIGPGDIYNSKSIKARLQEQVAAIGLSPNELDSAQAALSSTGIPLAVVSSQDHIKVDSKWSELQRSLTKITGNNVAWKILKGGSNPWENLESRNDLQDLLQKMS